MERFVQSNAHSLIVREDILSVGMAAANAWGLLLLTLMLGYGLVEFPRSLWYSASTRWTLTDCEMSAPRLREAAIDADTEVYDVTRVIIFIDE